MNFNEKLENILKQNEKFCDNNGELLKQKVKSYALEFDEDLIGALLNDADTREHFFKEISDATIFDYRKFIDFMDDKNFLLDSYTKFSNKVGLTISNKHIKQIDDVVLTFPFKDCVLEGGQSKEDENRKEIFFNETLAKDEINRLLDKKVITNATKYYYENKEVKETTDVKFTRDKEINKARGLAEDTITDNLIIKGNNLLALHTLKSNFAGKVKLIYIDPPYNTGNDSFGYNDNFNHSTWLTFMKNRLEIAKELLADDGLIFVQCDFNEDSYVKILMDDIFKEDLYVTTITVKSNSISGNKTQHKDKTILKNKDSILVYKNTEKMKLNPQYTEKYEWDTHYNSILIKNKNNEYIIKRLKDVLIEEGIIDKKYTIKSHSISNTKFYDFIFKNKEFIFRLVNSIPKGLESTSLKNKDNIVFINHNNEKMFAFNGSRLSFLSKSFKTIDGNERMAQLLGDLWTDIDFQNTQNEGGVSLANGKKPEALIQRIINLSTSENDIVLDFHLGSGTTCAVAHKINRQYIGIEQMDYIKSLSIKRMKNVLMKDKSGISEIVDWKGGGEFIYLELDKYNQKFIDNLSVSTEKNILNVYDNICEKGFLNYDIELTKIKEHFEEFKAFSLEQQKEFLISMLNKNQLYKNLSEIDDKNLEVSDEIKELNKSFYNISDKE